MTIKKTFRGEIFLYFSLVFILFTVAILIFQYQREKKYRTAQLENTLDNITEITCHFIEQNNLIQDNKIDRVKELQSLFPQSNTRITVVDNNGEVLFDSFVGDYQLMENHLMRPEIQKAVNNNFGSYIRESSTTNLEFYYYARHFKKYFIRAAVVYNIEVKTLLKTGSVYIVFVVGLFALIGILLFWVTGRLADVITKLKDFSIKARKNELVEFENTFPENELGIIGRQIIQIYNNLKKTKDELSNEKEKLFNHLDALDEGIAFFSSEKVQTLSNSRFFQYVNLISKKAVISPEKMLKAKEFKSLIEFLNRYAGNDILINTKKLPQFEYTVSKNEKYFKIHSIIFANKSFEVVITDVTRLEKRRLLKQQLTSNIAHELKTPLASISGYLETILENSSMPQDKQKYFIEKAFNQSGRLTELINDVSLINNIEDAGELFEFVKVDINKVVDDVYHNYANRIEKNKIDFIVEIAPNTAINGNESLLFSIFQNFVENSIRYAGNNIQIHIKCFHQDERYFYFSYSDTGVGIPDTHLPRIFERFYRIDHGRTREKGGTGLGLAIVKNAVQLHKGEISVKNNQKGGTEFLFSLSKK